MCPTVPTQCNLLPPSSPEVILQESVRLFGPAVEFITLGIAGTFLFLIMLFLRSLHDDN